MTDHDRTMRTLVVCFVVVIASLVGLRFIEVGNMSSSQVLGTVDQNKTIILPNAELKKEVTEARYIGE
jgi:hypothetical protein